MDDENAYPAGGRAPEVRDLLLLTKIAREEKGESS
jgi:hypothetical protein